ncbi:hypothetical protein M5689_013917 [Euphorbia peplus]|nr:hypothetical protein M5689_013917 [Euphorbia peplus]
MQNSEKQTLEGEGEGEEDDDESPLSQSQAWETMARAWLSAFPEAKAVSNSQVESWIDTNLSSLPSDLQSMPRPDLIDRLLAIQNFMRLPTQETGLNQVDLPHARFQRSDQWLPVYSWLETLGKVEVVKSKDISDWLAANPEIKEQLCSRHSRYHLMHYIKKCHMKILKRKDKKKDLPQTDKPTSPKDLQIVETKEIAPVLSNPLNNIPKDSDLYAAKRNEAVRKYEILVELEKKLSPHFSKRQNLQV